MRQYRGKIDDSGEAGDWVYGGIAVNGDRSFIIAIDECKTCGKESVCQKEDFPCYRNAVEVIPETVGQQTGLKAAKSYRNDLEIYEGDKVKIMTDREYMSSPSSKDKYKIEIAESGCPCGLNTNGMISTKLEGEKEYTPQMEIIGTIHDKEQA